MGVFEPCEALQECLSRIACEGASAGSALYSWALTYLGVQSDARGSPGSRLALTTATSLPPLRTWIGPSMRTASSHAVTNASGKRVNSSGSFHSSHGGRSGLLTVYVMNSLIQLYAVSH